MRRSDRFTTARIGRLAAPALVLVLPLLAAEARGASTLPLLNDDGESAEPEGGSKAGEELDREAEQAARNYELQLEFGGLARRSRGLLVGGHIVAGLVHVGLVAIPHDYFTAPIAGLSVAALPMALDGWKGEGLRLHLPAYEQGLMDFETLRAVHYVRWRGIGYLAAGWFCVAQALAYMARGVISALAPGAWYTAGATSGLGGVYGGFGAVFLLVAAINLRVADRAEDGNSEAARRLLRTRPDLSVGPSADLRGVQFAFEMRFP